MQTTTITVDVGLIVTALAPTIAIVVAGYFARKDAKAKDAKIEEIHALVNSDATAQKAKLLAVMKSQRVMMVGLKLNDTDKMAMTFLDEQIVSLEKEIQAREAATANSQMTKGVP